jgi:nucleoid DNA-binding protein
MESTVAELKTKKTRASVKKFIDAIEDEQKRKDSRAILEMMKKITGKKPEMWGEAIVGFGKYHYKYKSGREGEWFLTGFSPRKQNLTLYIMSGFYDKEPLLDKLGKFKTGKACLYIKGLDDVHVPTLKKLIAKSVKQKAQMGAA